MNNDLAIYGFGGFGREVAAMIQQINQQNPTWNLVGFFDDGFAIGTNNKYGKVLGGIQELNKYSEPLNVIFAIANPITLKHIYLKITNSNIVFPNIYAPNVNCFDKDTMQIGKGNLIFYGCRISTDVKIGDFNLMNGAVSVGHDVTIGSFNVFGPSVRISGECSVGDENFFGVNSVVLQGNLVGNNTRIGAGAVVMRNTKDDQLYMGNPAIKVKL
jgi:sugar O-acyltransferase (sialic acid O-acetyltransferase NeuD family)